MKYRQCLESDLRSSLDEVERGYIRKPVTVLITLIAIIPYVVIAIIINVKEFYTGFIIPCWKGPK